MTTPPDPTPPQNWGDPTTSHRIVIVEDHALIAAGLAAAMRARGHEAVVLPPTRADTATVLAAAPDVVLHDLDLGEHGLAVDRVTALAGAGCRVVLVTGVTEPVAIARAVAGGVVAVVDKADPFDLLEATVAAVVAGRDPIDHHAREEHRAVLRRDAAARRRRLAPFEALTPREQSVLAALGEGEHVDAIARRQGVASSTVRSHVRGVLGKLGVRSQLEAVALARESGWLDTRSDPSGRADP